MTKIPSVEDKVVTEFFTKCRVHLRSDPHGRCAVEHALVQTLTADRLALLTELREHVNQIAYHDDWDCHVLDYDKIKARLDELMKSTSI